jgi:hypothetical protein
MIFHRFPLSAGTLFFFRHQLDLGLSCAHEQENFLFQYKGCRRFGARLVDRVRQHLWALGRRQSWGAYLMNPVSPSLMSTAERIGAICQILALGVIRMRAAKSTPLSAESGESSLHFAPDQSGRATPAKRRTA